MWVELGVTILLWALVILLQLPLLLITIIPFYDISTGSQFNQCGLIGKILCVSWVILLSIGWFILDMCFLEMLEVI